jgi:cellulose synthase/poly-beta-1,6-N-acetylglucosamine synthase-like glycosyltransferase
MSTESIAEDFVTGMFMHEKGYRSVYVPEVLAEGLACEDLLSYSKQQFRWARGALDIIFRYNPLLAAGSPSRSASSTWPPRASTSPGPSSSSTSACRSSSSTPAQCPSMSRACRWLPSSSRTSSSRSS